MQALFYTLKYTYYYIKQCINVNYELIMFMSTHLLKQLTAKISSYLAIEDFKLAFI